jgi:inner membrane protein
VASVPTTLLPPVGGQFDLRLEVELAGTGTIAWVPLAGENQVTLSAPWPHPSFGGDFLPSERRISDDGFEARWSVPALSTRARQQFLAPPDKRGALEHLAVSLSDPVDVYRLTDRATKYGSLFILLTFGACFVLEMVRCWRMHPMQYLMVGAALVVFFLLLLSLSERWGFAAAYLTASLACVALVGWYLRHVLDGWFRAAAVSGLLAGLYGALYVILMSEDNALMMGSVLLFGALATTMAATRRLDWYGVLGGVPASPGGMPPKTVADLNPA